MRGAVGEDCEDCVVLTPDPPWKRSLTAYARVPSTGAAAAFVDLLSAAWPPLGPDGPHENCEPPAA
ncbi:hypothetical protein [Streptomyces flaveolus]|uniref:hypothetical protein n=1 Tax=Streptomyces flaveolus TaxID=67297 RepID=UPI003F540E74